ncbi:protein translocase subunit SecF [Vibrio sp. 10N.261.46.E12]|uniref:protein translocase subunit SecF n=1 Tax=unclassified Vibrio TaxID=2614977 RepID=UPI000976062D|nr:MULTISPECIES: protein translocase subunit SecF [unclassified Vibrio]OMO35996.1 protein-export membrane protein SecF [Vibrio sp. 10N.261.45.E1]PMJ19938.1 protein-export membrane protein SecF [Vibrio sp. 10N.286.45.B6]PML85331.1 protein-export membrane protein SecF [Vibrio sp. 10N.261.49.E11]PMM72657.1 protein-export membrane protein SecF [Vibrio sp. 10N.261.46.F12]PMM84125.1 protein-export membrane protein SecF [Vibrio sp. 10N.261.46.E8]
MSTSKMINSNSNISDRYITDSNMTRLRKVMSMISIVLFMSSVMLVAVKGFNWGLDFTGGVVAEVQLSDQVTKDALKTKLDTAFQQDVQVVGMAEQDRWTIRYSQLTDTPQPNLVDALTTVSDQVKVLNSSVVGPQVGQDMVDQGGLAVLVCFLMIMLYLSVRFEWRLALGALAAIIYDVTLILGLFAFTQFEFNLTVLAAVLAILGYSLNDSIIIADRVREMLRGNPNGETDNLLNESVKATFSRTMVTSGTTLITVSALWLLGGAALQGFAIALVVGIVSGTWSSVSVGITLPKLLGLQPCHYQVKAPVEVEGEYP